MVGDYKVPAKSMNTMTGYELIHKPTLFNHTALGRRQQHQADVTGKPPKETGAYGSLTLTTAGDTVSR